MKIKRLPAILLFAVLIPLLLAACSSREVKNLQMSVADLEGKMVNYQQKTSQESAETVSKVGEVNESINKAFRDIRYSQSNMETLIDQLSDRLAKVERDVTALQQNTNQIHSFSNDSYSNLTEKFSSLEQTSKIQRQQDLEAIQKSIDALSTGLASIKTDNDRSKQTVKSLEKQFSTLSEENRGMYRRILEELGAKVPDEKNQAPAPSGEPPTDSGNVHEVKSGESLSKIAAKYNVSLQAIKQLNNIDNASDIRVGQRIKIPK